MNGHRTIILGMSLCFYRSHLQVLRLLISNFTGSVVTSKSHKAICPESEVGLAKPCCTTTLKDSPVSFDSISKFWLVFSSFPVEQAYLIFSVHDFPEAFSTLVNSKGYLTMFQDHVGLQLCFPTLLVLFPCPVSPLMPDQLTV